MWKIRQGESTLAIIAGNIFSQVSDANTKTFLEFPIIVVDRHELSVGTVDIAPGNQTRSNKCFNSNL